VVAGLGTSRGRSGSRDIFPASAQPAKAGNKKEGGMKNVYLQCLFFTNAHSVCCTCTVQEITAEEVVKLPLVPYQRGTVSRYKIKK